MDEENRHAKYSKTCYGYLKAIKQYVIGSEETITRTAEVKDRLVNDGTLEFTPINSATAALWERS